MKSDLHKTVKLVHPVSDLTQQSFHLMIIDNPIWKRDHNQRRGQHKRSDFESKLKMPVGIKWLCNDDIYTLNFYDWYLINAVDPLFVHNQPPNIAKIAIFTENSHFSHICAWFRSRAHVRTKNVISLLIVIYSRVFISVIKSLVRTCALDRKKKNVLIFRYCFVYPHLSISTLCAHFD